VTRTVRNCSLVIVVLVLAIGNAGGLHADVREPSSFQQVVAQVQPKMVKIYGAGGTRGLEAYQSGFLISAEGHVLTVWSYVLDTDYISVTLDDGRKFEAKLVGADPRLEIAVLKIEATELDHFKLAESAAADAGTRVLALSNLFGVATGDEPASVQHGTVSAKARLDARRGAFQSPYSGPVYVLDAMTNNPGAAGGALVNQRGQLLGMLGKELRNSLTNTWLNYALPTDQFTTVVDEILSGKFRVRSEEQQDRPANPLKLAMLGIELVPDILERTPPFIDRVRSDSPAAMAGLRADDLVVFVGDRLVQSCKSLDEELLGIEQDSSIKLVVMRGQELVSVELKAAALPKQEAPKPDPEKPNVP
jgi:S1-C subfamily serine protease